MRESGKNPQLSGGPPSPNAVRPTARKVHFFCLMPTGACMPPGIYLISPNLDAAACGRVLTVPDFSLQSDFSFEDLRGYPFVHSLLL